MNKSLIAICGALLLIAVGCAAPGAPLPPSLRLAVPVENLSAVRKGDRVVLSWTPPSESTDKQSIHWPTRTRICRVLNQFPIKSCGTPVRQLEGTELESAVPGGRHPVVSMEDVLPPELIGAQNQVSYAVEVVNGNGRSAGLSNQVLVPLAPTPPAPAEFNATLDADGPLLEWTAEPAPAPAGVQHRLRLSRRERGKSEFITVAELPYHPSAGEARDPGFEWEHEYDYRLNTVTVLSAAGNPNFEVLGNDSRLVYVVTHDIFPPAVPTGLQAVFSSVGQQPFIDLIWAPDSESDLAGYLVYRRAAGAEFVPVTAEPIRAPAWRDHDVQPGVTYYYAVSALDVRHNQSDRSATAEETVPKETR
jgi:hypothetical protein